MNAVMDLVRHPAAQALAWSLVHFLWQGAALGLVAMLALRVWRPADASVRYLVGVGLMAAMLAAPVATFGLLLTAEPDATPAVTVDRAPAPRAFAAVTGEMITESPANPAAVRALVPPAPRPASAPASAPLLTPASLLLILAGWTLGVCVLSIRLLGGWLLARRLARRGTGPAPDALVRLAAEVARRLRVARQVALALSPSVTVPTVIGWVRPVVVLPLSALAELTPAQVEAILAHELAHVRRHDYLVNLLQAAVETLLFYHPCVWWLSAEVRKEREHCCDDLAVAACGDRLVYVSALAELAANGQRAFALAATDGSLLSRVRRLLGRPRPEREAAPLWAPAALGAMALAGLLAMTMAPPAADAESARQPAAPPAATDAAQASPAPAAPAMPVAAAAPRLEDAPEYDHEGQPVPPPAPEPPVAPLPPGAPAAPLFAGDFWGQVPPVPPVPDVPDVPDPPDPPDPPDAPDVDQGHSGSGNMTWSTDTERLRVQWTGPFRLTADERDLEPLERGDSLTITEGRGRTTSMTIRRTASGALERTFRRNGRAVPADADAQAWLAATLQKAFRQTGMFAEQRVARLLASGGPEAVLAEIDRFASDSSYAKRRYYQELLEQATLTPALVTRVLDRLPKDLTSDYELARTLRAVLERPDLTDAQRMQIARAAGALGSDYEHRRVLAAVLASGTLTPGLVTSVLDQARRVESDYERSRLLRDLIDRGGVTEQTAAAFVALVGDVDSAYERSRVLRALAGSPALTAPVVADAVRAAAAIDGDYERSRTLQAFLARPDAGPEATAAVLAASSGAGGSYEQAKVLLALVEKGGLTPQTAEAFFKAATAIDGDYERAKVLQAALGTGRVAAPILDGVLKSAATMHGDYERSKLLVRIAETQALTDAQRDLFYAVVDGIGSRSEQDRALAALARATRR
ncbi:MAG: M56 family metallopeptidase [Vicinamibacterales bacterium]